METKEYTITVFCENHSGLLNRISIIFTRRKVNIESITASESELRGVHRFTIVITASLDMVKKITSQIEKQVEVLKAYFHESEDMVYQEIALYKVPTTAFAHGGKVEQLVRNSNARILNIEPEYTIIEKTGQEEETQALFEQLKPYGVLGFVRSGRVALVRGIGTLSADIKEMDVDQIEVSQYVSKTLVNSVANN